jgi:P2 family phage contractile tail tube protein
MEFKIKWSSFYADSLALFTDPFTPLSLQIRASAEVYTSAGRTDQIPVVIYLTCQNKGFPGASFKQHENADLESTLGATYMKVVMNGSDIIEFDVLANIFKVNGVDLLAGYKANIGG